MKELKKHKTKKWWIAHNGSNVVHHGVAEVGRVVTTGQPNLEEFTVRGYWKARLKALGVIIDNVMPKPPL